MINFDVLIAKVIIAIFGSFLLVQSKGIFGSNIVPLSDKILFVIIFTSLALYEIYYTYRNKEKREFIYKFKK